MEVISIDGVEYEKVTTLAKRFKYTTDYIGQLCRAGKVEAKLIGRTWYVHEPSLQNHKKVRYQKTSPDDKKTDDVSKIKISRLDVAPVLAKTTAKVIETKARQGVNFARRVDWKPVRYVEDDSALLPELSVVRTKEPVSLPVDLADSTVVRVKKASPTTTDLEPIALPAVALQGEVPVTSAENYFDNTKENIAISDDFFTDSIPEEQERPVRPVVRQVANKRRALVVHDEDTEPRSLDAGITKPVSVEQIRPASIIRGIGRDQSSSLPEVLTGPVPFPWLGLSILTVVFVVVLFLVTVVEQHSTADAVVFSSTLSWSDASELARLWQKVIHIF